ncbi:MAG TPA: phytanoyl-CoA dioxygenase family protein [Pyrinomonadaceae bacterium]|nr:phytanoyl-CoA dioxygenase family protein [Pyrinomonadaceae bacterium]
MRSLKEIQTTLEPVRTRGLFRPSEVDVLSSELETNGIVVLPNLLNSEQLGGMQKAFDARLRRMRWNNFDGYDKTERFRHMIEDVLLLDQGFLDLALHPLVKQILNRYLGADYELTEAKGWKSLPTRRDFHGWHGDAWYDQSATKEIHREIKLAMYLTDVRSGAFNFVKGSHRQQHPRLVKNDEVKDAQIFEVRGPAGTAFLFDTSGIHRQGVPMLETRQALFYNYHDPGVPLQQEDLITYRYHPLLLNAAFLGNLSDEDRRILGFGNKTNFVPAFERQDHPPASYQMFCAWHGADLRFQEFRERVVRKLRKTFRLS